MTYKKHYSSAFIRKRLDIVELLIYIVPPHELRNSWRITSENQNRQC